MGTTEEQLAADYAECPVCGATAATFLPAGLKQLPERKCPNCTSLERHRAMWLFCQQRTNLFSSPLRLLHIAPEKAMGRPLAAIPNVEYLSADLNPARAMVTFDLRDIPYPDGSFDAIFASHVLEHIPEDRQAMSEMHRVLSPGGWAILLVPMWGPKTREDLSVDDPAERQRLYGQDDHVRMYGHDGEYERRLEGVGFDVNAEYFVQTLDPTLVRRYRLDKDELIHFCTKSPAAANGAGA